MTHFFSLIFIILFSTSAIGSVQIWQANKNGLTLTLLGSIHAGKEQFYPLPSFIYQQLKKADALIVEADISSNIPTSFNKSLSTAQLINEQQKSQLSKISHELNLPIKSLLALPPWQSAMALQQAQIQSLGLSPELGVDLHLLKKAQQWQIPIISLESIEQQIDLISSIGQDGLGVLTDTLSNWHQSKTTLPCLIKAWQKGDSKTLSSLAQIDEGDIEKTLLIDRNHQWMTKINKLISSVTKNYVVVVGALHLYSNDGLLTLLKEQGFNLQLKTKNQNANCLNNSKAFYVE